MIIEDEEGEDFDNFLKVIQIVLVQRGLTFGQLLQSTFELEDRHTHFVVRNDLENTCGHKREMQTYD
jgi:hypothetical protein